MRTWSFLTMTLLGASVLGAVALAQTPAAPARGGRGGAAQTPETAALLRRMGDRGVGAHDPSTIIKCKDEYWYFPTGNAGSMRSRDLLTWTPGPSAVSRQLPWARGGGFWAPDVIKVKDQYFLFLSNSSFGVNTSVIGVLSNPTLDPDDPAFRWTDRGEVVRSQTRDDFNAIDPALLLDDDGRLWMSFGSFWSGIKLIELNPDTGLRIAPDSPMYSLAHWDSIEAPYIYKRDGKYYLFVSHGMCCRGANSTYHTRVGRSDKITGPYVDKEGKDMLLGGGTPFMQTNGAYIGPGHAGIIEVEGKYWVSHHFYLGGGGRLAIRPLTWDADGWPVAGEN